MLRQALESVLAHMLESASPVRLSSARKRNSPPPPPHQHVIPKLALAGAAHAGSNGLLHRLCDARQVEGAAAAGLAGSAGCGVGAAVGRRRQARGRPRSKAAAALNCPSAASPARLDQRCLRLAALLGLFDRTDAQAALQRASAALWASQPVAGGPGAHRWELDSNRGARRRWRTIRAPSCPNRP